MVMRLATLAILGLVVLSNSPPAWGQWGSIREPLEGLQPSDIALMRETAQERMNGQEVGTRLTWQNPDTGNRGVVALLDKTESGELECRLNRHSVEIAASGRQVLLEFKICREPGGVWQSHQ